MGVEIRNGRSYVYRKERRGDRVVSVYVGPAGTILADALAGAARLMAEGRAIGSAAGSAPDARAGEIDEVMGRVAAGVRELAELAMHAAGYHRPGRKPWRRVRRMKVVLRDDDGPDEIPLDRKARDDFRDRAMKGDETTRKAIRKMVADNPELIPGMRGDAAKMAEQWLVGFYAGKDITKQEATYARLRQIRDDLAGPDPTPIERLLAERAALCWLAANSAEIEAIRQQATPFASRFDRRCVTAHQRYVNALKALATVRRLAVPEIRMALDARSVNVTVAPPPGIEAPEGNQSNPPKRADPANSDPAKKRPTRATQGGAT